MKYILLLIALFLIGAAVFKALFPGSFPPELLEEYSKQQNPFLMPKDSSEVVWERACYFLEEYKRMIVGGTLQKTDSELYIPYYNQYHKGNSLRIQRKTIGDSVAFSAIWWYSGEPMDLGAKEILYFMKTGIDKYNYKK